VALALLVAGAWLFSSALFSGKVLAGDDLLLFTPPLSEVKPPDLAQPSNELNFDSAHVFHPDLIAARRAIRGFELPAWTNTVGAGRPLLAAQQSAPLYPTNLPAYVMPFWDSLELTALLKVLLAGVGMALFCRSLGLRAGPALIGAVAFACSTYFVGWLAHPHTNVYLVLPWILLGVRELVRRPSPLAAVGLGAVLGLALLGGHPPSLLLIGLLAVPYLLFELASAPSGRAARLLVGALLIGVLIGAVMLIPFLEGLGQAADADVRGGQALPRSTLNAIVFPEFWGRPDKFQVADSPSSFQERTGYFGVLPLLLAVAGLTVRPAREQLFFAAAAIGAALVVWVQTVAELLDGLPGFESVNLWRSLILIVFCGSVLAAFGLQRLLEASRAERLRMTAVMGTIVAVVGGQWLVRHTGSLDELGAALRKLPVLDREVTGPDPVLLSAVLRWCLLGVAAVAIAALAVWRPRLAAAAAAMAVALTTADLVSMGRGYHPAVDRATVDIDVPPSVRFLQEASADGSRSMGEGFTWPANLSARFETLDPREHELPSIERTHRLWLGLGGAGSGNTQQRKLFTVGAATDRLADLFAVRWLYAPTLAAAPRAGYRPVSGVSNVVENVDALPRAWVAHGWRSADGLEAALTAVAASTSAQLLESPVIEGATPRATAGAAAEPARVESEEADEIVLSADAGRGGFLVLADTFYPGWKAEVDGREAEIRPANAAFRAIALPPGRHEVRFAYESAAVRWGWIATLLGLAVAAAVAVAALALRRRSASA
jgi:hypothetical protein